jgi:hypothetical protein
MVAGARAVPAVGIKSFVASEVLGIIAGEFGVMWKPAVKHDGSSDT